MLVSGPGGVNRDRVRMRVDLPDEEVRGVFVEWPGGGRAFFLGGKNEGPVVGLGAGVLGEVAPGTVPGEAADKGSFAHGFGFGAEEREDGSRDDGDVRAVDELQHS